MRSLQLSQGNLPFSILLTFHLLITPMEAARILFALPFSAPSHNIVFNTLAKELSSRGHHITIITPFPIPFPPDNYRQIDNSEILAPFFTAPKPKSGRNILQTIMRLRFMSSTICRATYEMPEVKELIISSRTGTRFDLVFSSLFFNDCFHALSHVFNASLVLMSPAGSFPMTDSLVGNPALPSFSPVVFSAFSDRMNFYERIINTVMYLIAQIFHNYFYLPVHDEVARKSIGDAMPPLWDIQKEVSLVLLNSHFSFLYPRPAVPSLVEVGGMHLKPAKPLPGDIQKFMDDAKDGVIYFSMGSNLKSTELPEDTRDALLGAFGELKQKIMWKWEEDTLPGMTPNLKLSKWWPQSDVLAHPNTKLFITHGGLLSFQEAITRGVPMIGIPVYGDQKLNMKRVVSLGVGLEMNINSMTKESILNTINTVLTDQTYTDNMKRLSSIFKDQSQPPLEKAVYWIEYVLRHNGASHLRSAGVDLQWYQFYMIDIAATLILVIVIMLIIVALVIKCLLRSLSLMKRPKMKQQ